MEPSIMSELVIFFPEAVFKVPKDGRHDGSSKVKPKNLNWALVK